MKFAIKKLNPQINLLLNFFNSEIFLPWQSYLEYKLLGVGAPITDWSRYIKVFVKHIQIFGIDKYDVEIELTLNLGVCMKLLPYVNIRNMNDNLVR